MWKVESGMNGNCKVATAIVILREGNFVSVVAESIKIAGAARSIIPHSTLHIPNFLKRPI